MSKHTEYTEDNVDLANLISLLDPAWAEFFNDFLITEDYKKLHDKVQHAYQHSICYPSSEYIFQAFKYVIPSQVKVIILGQDPYHQPGQAMGLAFSVPKEIPIPPSLKNIYKELQNCMSHFETPTHGNLEAWAQQGVLLLNTSLSVEYNKANSHKNFGWHLFTDYCIKKLSTLNHPKIFALWGNAAKSKKKLIMNNDHNFVLEATHPSPLGANKGGWFGNQHFNQINEFLKEHQIQTINWTLSNY